MWQRQRKEQERTLSTCRKPILSISSKHGGWLCFLLFYVLSSMLLQSQVFVLVVLSSHLNSQASWNCPGGGHPCHSRHPVETLQWVWAAENVPPGHLPVHHRPSTTREKGKGLAYERWKHQAHVFHLRFTGRSGWSRSEPIVFCCWITVVAPPTGRVCVAQDVCRQPRPRFCGTAESRPGKLPTACRIASHPLQW